MKKKYKISTYFKGGRRNMSKKTKMVSYLSLAHIKSSEISHSHLPVMCQYISQVQLRRRNASLTSITTINQNKQKLAATIMLCQCEIRRNEGQRQAALLP